MSVRVRLAPSPTGLAHVGHAYIALFNLAFARRQGGQFILRIEDTDRVRHDPAAEAVIFEGLRWLKLDWDEGPDVGGPHAPYRQSERREIYRAHAEQLLGSGHAYRCWCTPERLARVREEQQRRKEPPRYDRFCLGKSEAERRREPDCADVPVIRLKMPDEGESTFHDLIRGEISFQNRLIDDQVLIKSDGFPTYHLAVVVDDHLMEISHIIRGEEWISSTPKHVQLHRAFGWEMPQVAHLSLLRNVDKSKISKRKHPWANLPWFRSQGYLPEALVNFLGLMGFSMPDGREVFSFEEFSAAFDWSRVGTTAPAFDLEKLSWLNGVYIRNLSLDELIVRARPFLIEAGLHPESDEYLRRVLRLEQERIHRLAEAPELTSFFFQERLEYDPALLVPKGLTPAQALAALETAGDEFEAAGPGADPAALEERFRALAERLGLKTGQLFSILRVAITGTTKAPPLFDTAVTLGHGRVMARIEHALGLLRQLAAGASPSSQASPLSSPAQPLSS
ncbi:MAG TPA: glutamate--tRNA ligase [Chloroflexota bacterium]|nr:glutamate--tRNA ligase [Chloroflexota bacterium]